MDQNKSRSAVKSANEAQLLLYKDLISAFFEKNYPLIDNDQFWNWFLSQLSQKKLDMQTLSAEDLQQFLTHLTDLGDQVIDFNLKKSI